MASSSNNNAGLSCSPFKTSNEAATGIYMTKKPIDQPNSVIFGSGRATIVSRDEHG